MQDAQANGLVASLKRQAEAKMGVLGPMYPIAINHAGRVLPQWLLTSSIGHFIETRNLEFRTSVGGL